MDPSLSRLARMPGEGSCPASASGALCADDASFEQLAAELAGALAPPIGRGAATDGPRSFYIGLNTTLTTLRHSSSYWQRGTRGADPTASRNAHVDPVLSWNRLEVRKGLPFGFEVGSSLGFGLHTAMWLLSAELKLALFEGFRSGLGALPDVALRAVTQQLVGASELSLRTNAVDVTLSKPYVLGRQHVLTPLLALQLLFVTAKSGVVDLTPATHGVTSCDPTSGDVSCSGSAGAADLANNVTFRTIHRTRVRAFVGAEERFRLLSIALTLGFDLSAPELQSESPGDDVPRDLLRQFSLHLACGLRY